MRKTLIALTAAAGLAAVGGTAAAAPIPVDGVWRQAVTQAAVPAFFPGSLEFTCGIGGCRFDISDNRVISDQFEVYNFGALIGTTPKVPDWNEIGCSGPLVAACRVTDPDEAWADPRYSKLSLLLPADDYSITIKVIYRPPFGRFEEFADTTVQFRVTAVPLPAALPLFAAGVAALGFAAHRRRR